jgi:molecular chaperone Hsp33
MSDVLYRLMIPQLHVRAYAVQSLDTVRSIVEAHNTTPNATTALGRAISAGALLSASLKPDSDQTISMKIQGSGPVKEIQVQADAHGHIRGYIARPRVDEETDLGVISMPKALGAGLLTVTKDLGLKETYSGTTHLIKGEIALDVAYYLTSSEQVPSAVVLALMLDKEGRVASAGGILIQTLPDTPEDAIGMIEKKLAKPYSSLGTELLRGTDIREYLSQLLSGEMIETLSATPVVHRCRCSRERIESMLASLDTTDLDAMILEDGGADVHCTFCNTLYTFTKSELEAVRVQ